MPGNVILRPQMDRGNNILLLLGDAHVAACGFHIEGAAAPSMHPRGLSTVCRRVSKRAVLLFLLQSFAHGPHRVQRLVAAGHDAGREGHMADQVR